MNIIGVTACPTGIAHSQMAAENLETIAEERGHDIHVEIEGAMGTENELSDAQIANADVVVIAADTTVHTDKFGDLPIVKGTVKDAVNRADELIDEAERKGAEAADASADAGSTDDTGSDDASATAGSSDTEGASAGSGGADAAQSTGGSGDDRGERKGIVGKLKSLFS